VIDDLELEDEEDGAQAPAPAFYVSPPATEAELILIEQMHRTGARPEFRGAGVMIFTRDDEETGVETWDEGASARWQAIMRWPREPTIAEAMAWQANANARLLALFWDRLEAVSAGEA
jgi:hypothetical protein